MLFQRKIERAQRWLKERTGSAEVSEQTCDEGELPSMEELKAEGRNEFRLEKGDLPAMLVAAFFTIMPVCVIVLLLICSLVFLL